MRAYTHACTRTYTYTHTNYANYQLVIKIYMYIIKE